MSKRETFSRYSLIINKLKRSSSSLDEINDYLDRESALQGYNFRTSQRTFQRDINEISSIFNIEIAYNRSKKVYYIDYEGQPEASNRMLEAFDTFNALNVSDGLSNYIHFEKRKPQGAENLYGILHAIKNRFQIKFAYHKFWDEDPSNRTAAPYVLKEFNNRWYVMAKDSKDENIKSFALDRVLDFEITNKKFEYPANYNVEESYRYCFGIISPNEQKPEEIILSFEPIQGKYIKTLPLHETQTVLIDNDDELQIQLKLYITRDLVMELLSYGDKMQVLKPKSLIDEIKNAHKQALLKYEI